MKKLFFVLTLALFASATQVNAQNEDYRSTASISVGQSVIGAVFKLTDDALSENGETINTSVTPAIELAFDYGLTKWFSLGAAATYQGVGLDITDYTFLDANNELQSEDFTSSISRTALSIRPLFHYGNSGKLDMYSGLRLGASIWSLKSDSTDPNYSAADGFESGTSLHVSLVAFGLRYYFTDNIGAGFELHAGTPYLAKIGATARF